MPSVSILSKRDGPRRGAGAKKSEWRGYMLLRNIPRQRGLWPPPWNPAEGLAAPDTTPLDRDVPPFKIPDQKRAALGTSPNRPPVGCRQSLPALEPGI